MKKLISLLGLLLIISTTMFTSCDPEPKPKPEPGISDPIEKPGDPENPGDPEEPKVEEMFGLEFIVDDMELDGNKPSTSWAYFTKDLSDFADKNVLVSFTADVKVENNTAEDYNIWFQVNNGSEYPGINGEGDLFAPGESEKTITGSAKIKINNGAMLYLTTGNSTADVKISIKNFKYYIAVVEDFEIGDYELDGMKPESSWAYFTKDLSAIAGKEVLFDLSADVKVVNNTAEDYKIWFQINNGSEYPAINGEGDLFAPGESEKTITGSAKITINNGAMLYLTTHNSTADVKISIKNAKCTVAYVPSTEDEPEVPAKEYPTDIFTVGEADTCGIQIGDGELKPFKIFTQDGASSVKTNSDGSVEWMATAQGGAGGGVSFFVNSDESEINMANYESIELEFVYSPITGKWNPKASNPGFCLRILPWDSTGIFGGAIDLQYFDAKDEYGTYKGTFEIPADFADKVIASSSQDVVKAFALKFNDYQRGNDNGDQVKVQLKKVKFNRKANAPADKPFDDGLTDEQRGTVKSIYYPTKDYAAINKGEEPTEYEKHAWVYLPAGYDAEDKNTKYPVFILIHGHGQNENTWGLTDQGNGGKIKGYMDRGMASGEYEKFILVCATGIASKNWGPNGAGTDMDGSNAFGGELRNDLLPYIRENYNVAEGRDNVALAGLSMGGGQTMNIGIGQCLDLISWFGAYSAAIFNTPQEYFPSVEAAFPDLDLNYLYMICGDADNLVIDGVRGVVNYINTTGWDKVGGKERFSYTEVPGGTHDFPVWFQGFDEFSRIIFKK